MERVQFKVQCYDLIFSPKFQVQDGRVLDVAVIKEPFRDRYAIFGEWMCSLLSVFAALCDSSLDKRKITGCNLSVDFSLVQDLFSKI
jgi:hypothetical protein